jgi:nitrous oxide reductase accessory protein NosL
MASRARLLAAALAIGCAGPQGPRPIPLGADCDACGMAIHDLHYACENERDGRYRFYDSIECLIRARPGARAWLTDYDSRSLHAADSMWVVHAEIPSPMGGGFAAFADRAAAEEIARARAGRVDRLAAFAASDSAHAAAR